MQPGPLCHAAPACLHSPPSPGAWQGASREASPGVSFRLPTLRAKGQERNYRLCLGSGGLGEHQMFKKAWLRKFPVSLLSVLVSC